MEWCVGGGGGFPGHKIRTGACLSGNIHAMWVVGMTARVALPVCDACPAGGRSHTINVAVELAADSRV